MGKNFNINLVLLKLKEKRKIFVSETDLQIEIGFIIKELYPTAKVRAEYCPSFNSNMHIDIVVIYEGNLYAIELKYKTKKCCKMIDNEIYNLKEHSAKDVNSYLYLKDIERIEQCRDNIDNFKGGYTLFITNDLSYCKKPIKENCIYKKLALDNDSIKSGILNWEDNASIGTKKNCDKPLNLKSSYKIKWQDYSKIDNSSTGTFIYLLNEISNFNS